MPRNNCNYNKFIIACLYHNKILIFDQNQSGVCYNTDNKLIHCIYCIYFISYSSKIVLEYISIIIIEIK